MAGQYNLAPPNITTPKSTGGKVKFVQLSMVDEEQILAVIVMEGNLVKNKIIPLTQELTLQSFMV